MTQNLSTIGWREWVALPDLNLPAIKAKIDTGAKTSALHAFNIKPISRNNIDCVSFSIHPIQKNNDLVIHCEAPIFDQRMVMDSGGHKEYRYVIESTLILDNEEFLIEITLTNRDNMKFRMLLGRRAMKNKHIVNPAKSYLKGKLDPTTLYSPINSSSV